MSNSSLSNTSHTTEMRQSRPEHYDTAQLQAIDRRHYLHPFTDFRQLQQHAARIIVKADGIWLWDSDGKQILDAMAGLWCVNAGYGRSSITAAVSQQMQTLPYYNSFFNTSNIPALKLAEKLAQLSPEHMQHVFFTSSGSEANDTNLRLIRRYWDVCGEPQRRMIISRHNGYHGSTIAAASLGGMRAMHEQVGMRLEHIVHIDQPDYVSSGHGRTVQQFGLEAAGWLEQTIRHLGPEQVAAFFAEPIQGAGGVIIPPATYWPEIQRICDHYGILLVADEVICGFGRLGHWFGSQAFGIRPDLLTFAKGITSGYLPLGGVLIGDRVASALLNCDGEFTHGYTYSGHPVACAAALENIRIIEREGLVEKVRLETGPHLAKHFSELADHPLVGYADSYGLVAGLNLVRAKAEHIHSAQLFSAEQQVGMLCRAIMFEQGVIMRAIGDRMIIAPPLCISMPEIDEMVRRIRLSLDLCLAELERRQLM